MNLTVRCAKCSTTSEVPLARLAVLEPACCESCGSADLDVADAAELPFSGVEGSIGNNQPQVEVEGSRHVAFNPAGETVTCSKCQRSYVCTPDDDYYNSTNATDGVCENCLVGGMKVVPMFGPLGSKVAVDRASWEADFDKVSRALEDGGWIVTLDDGSMAVSPSAPPDLMMLYTKLRIMGFGNGFLASRTASSDIGEFAGGGFFQNLVEWLRGHDTSRVPSWFPKRWLTPEEIATGKWSTQGGDPNFAFGSKTAGWVEVDGEQRWHPDDITPDAITRAKDMTDTDVVAVDWLLRLRQLQADGMSYDEALAQANAEADAIDTHASRTAAIENDIRSSLKGRYKVPEDLVAALDDDGVRHIWQRLQHEDIPPLYFDTGRSPEDAWAYRAHNLVTDYLIAKQPRQGAKRQPPISIRAFMTSVDPAEGIEGYPDVLTAPVPTVGRQHMRCSNCFNEWDVVAFDPAQPVPNCPNCGASTVTPAGANGVGAVASRTAKKVTEIVVGILATNPYMPVAEAARLAEATVRSYPKMVKSAAGSCPQCGGKGEYRHRSPVNGVDEMRRCDFCDGTGDHDVYERNMRDAGSWEGP